jgi:uncharacterized protein (TIRG00374 family)
MISTGKKEKLSTKWLPGVVISLLFILAFIFFIDWTEFGIAIKTIKPIVIFWTVVLSIIPLITRSFAWRNLLGNRVSFLRAFFGENIGYMVNNFLPFRLGEIARAFLLSDSVEGGFPAVLPSVFLERLIDLGFAALTLLIAIPFVVSESWMLPTVLLSLAVVLIGVLFLFFSLRKADFLENILTNLLVRFPGIQQTILRLFRQFIVGLQSAAEVKNTFRAVFFLALTWIGYWLSYYILVVSVAPDASFIWAMFTNGVVSLGIAIPSAPGSLGVWEAAFVAALAVFGVDQSRSLAVALVLHLVSYAITGLLGIIGLLIMGSSLNTLLVRVRQHRDQTIDHEIISGGE